MPSASYIRQNDYTPQQFKPYELPYNATLNEIATKTAYWNQGKDRIVAALTTAQGLDPQFEQNKGYLKSFVDDANKKLTKAAKSDLSQLDNSGAAAAIFNPLYDTSNPFNAHLLTDSQLSAFYKENSKLATAARTTNGGKTWSQNNQIYMDDAYQKYLNDAKNGNIDTIDGHWQNKKGYIPYYDNSDEIKGMIKNCHADSSEVTQEQGLYFHTTESRGVGASKMQDCLGFLSPQAKQQIGIDSYANYRGNKAGLLQDFQELIHGRATTQKNALVAQLGAAKAAKDKKEIARLTPLLEQATSYSERADKEWGDIVGKGDPLTYINDNYERISSVVGFQHFAEKAGTTFSWQEIKNKLSPNASAIATMNANKEMAMLGMKLNHDSVIEEQRQRNRIALEREKAKLDGKTPEDPYVGVAPIDNLQDVKDRPENPEMAVKNDIAEGYKQLGAAGETLSNLIAPFIAKDKDAKELYAGINNATISSTQLINFIDKYEKSHKGDKTDPISQQLKNIRTLNQDLQNKKRHYDTVLGGLKKIDVSSFSSDKKENTGIMDANGNEIFLNEQEVASAVLGNTVKGVNITQKLMGGHIHNNEYVFEAGDPSLRYIPKKDIFGNTNTRNIPQYTSSLARGTASKLQPSVDERSKAFQNSSLIRKSIFSAGGNKKINEETYLQAKTLIGIDNDDDHFISGALRDKDGNGFVRIYNKGRGDNANEALGEAGITSLVGAEKGVLPVNLGTKEQPIWYAKIPRLYSALPGYITGEQMQAVNDFSKEWMGIKKLPSGKSSDTIHSSSSYYDGTSPSGVPIRISVTNMNGYPEYLGEFNPTGDKWIEYPTRLTTPEQVLAFINSKHINPE